MKARFRCGWLGIALLTVPPVYGQGTFQNLDFEGANLAVIPSGQRGSFEPVGNALPFWNAYLGTNQMTQVLHNNFFTGSATVAILGPNWTFTQMIHGDYTVLLQPGFTEQGLVDASIGQTGLIPVGTQSLRFTSDSATHFFDITINSQSVPVLRISDTPFLAFYGANISGLAGTTAELRITAQYNALDNGFAFLDSLQFSNQPIPEPNTLGLLALGVLFVFWRLRKTP